MTNSIAPAPPVDLTDGVCAREQIHIIGHTQAHGFLIAVSEGDFVVTYISANLPAALGKKPEDVLGQPLEHILGARQTATVRASVAAGDVLAANPIAISVGAPARAMDCVAHLHDGMLLLEMEPRSGAFGLGTLNMTTHVKRPIERMEREADVEQLVQAAAREFRRTSGFDRVMIYRFDAEFHGQVIAEDSNEAAEFLGHWFPASDIPAQARRLFLINTLRSIADVESEPVPILSAETASPGRPLDLSHSLLRSASPIHLEYLRNMGVRATMTASIVVRGRLWGMVAAHHRSPHRLDFTTRALCELLAQILSAQIVARGDNALLQERLDSRDLLEGYMTSVERSAPSLGGEGLDLTRLLTVFHADGLVSRIDGVESTFGTTVETVRLGPAIAALRARAARGVAGTDHLCELDAAAAAYAPAASGALFLGLSEGSEDYILLLRRELIQTITWAGNPDKSVATDAGTGVLHPRASFASWREVVRGRSLPWMNMEIENAGLLREQLMQLSEAARRHKAEERVRYLARYDVLTALPNRSSMEDTLERALASAVKERTGFAVLFVDLDHFKEFNDTLGHAAGDRILQIVASRLQRSVRGEDTVGRIGGDEFIAVLPGFETEQEALEAAARLLAEIEKPFELGGDEKFRITASIGMSRYPSDGSSSELLLQHSDIAMYRAKKSGGNALQVFSPSLAS